MISPGRPGAYLERIMANLAAGRCRSMGARRRALRRAAASSDLEADPAYPSDLAELFRLPPHERAALYLAEAEGYGSEEIGRMLGCSEAAARESGAPLPGVRRCRVGCGQGPRAWRDEVGFLKQIKDMKQTVAEMPGMVEQAQKMAQQAQELQAAQIAAAQAAAGQVGAAAPGAVDPALLEPIAGISLERYAQLSKSIGERKLDQAGLESFVKLQGHSPEDWTAAYDGWNARFKGNMALSVRFGNLYQQSRSL